jgi:putative addiction module component (TIGR02574 family)
MGQSAEQVLAAALELPDADRIELIEALIDSVGGPDDPPFDESWRDVIRRRSAELASGRAVAVPWAEVKRRAREAAGADG